MLPYYLNFIILIVQMYIEFCDSQRQKVQCFDRDGQSGNSVVAKDYIPNLFYYQMKDRINSCCITGDKNHPLRLKAIKILFFLIVFSCCSFLCNFYSIKLAEVFTCGNIEHI